MNTYDSTPLGEVRTLLKQRVREDDSNTFCPCCYRRTRNDAKGMTRWQALALQMLYDFDHLFPNQATHFATLIQNTEAARDHGASHLRHWGLVQAVGRPDNADAKQKGSRGLSGFYVITDAGRAFVEGRLAIPKSVIKPFGEQKWDLNWRGSLIEMKDALRATLKVTLENMVADGTTV